MTIQYPFYECSVHPSFVSGRCHESSSSSQYREIEDGSLDLVSAQCELAPLVCLNVAEPALWIPSLQCF